MKRASASLVAVLACQPKPESAGSGSIVGAAEMTLESSAFAAGAAIPTLYTCEGADLSPPLRWSGVPAAAKSLALVVSDPDAPDPARPKRTWVHWVLVDLPPGDGGLPEGVSTDMLPQGTRVGRNDWGRAEYGGPCPPIGRHRYFHTLYALDARLSALVSPTKSELERAIVGHVLAQAELVGTYEKVKPTD